MRVAGLSIEVIRICGSAAFLITMCYLYSLIKAVHLQKKKKALEYYIPLFLISALITSGFENISVETEAGRRASLFSYLIRQLPYPLILGIMAILIVLYVAGWRSTERSARTMLSAFSLRQGLNQLPDGLLFGTMDGIPLLVNDKMVAVCNRAFGDGVFDTEHLKRRLINGEVAKGCRVILVNDNVNVLLQLDDGSVWDFRRTYIETGRGTIKEYLAYDVTEQYEKSRELEKRNAHLRMLNEKLRDYNRNMDAVIREREILDAKIRIHDEVGRTLLALRTYLAQEDTDEKQRKQLVDMWKMTISVLRREALAEETDDRMEALRQAAEAVEVELQFEGELPSQKKAKDMLAVAIHECLTNTVKHADGSLLRIKLERKPEGLIAELTNDGRPPQGIIRESGGLLSLRKTVEMNGGQMEVESHPRFLLRLRLPQGQEGKEYGNNGTQR